jgi:tetratricopeptide (TPR) repeat protein
LDKAEDYYWKALKIDYFSPTRFSNLAWFLIDNDRNIIEGVQLMEKVLELNPDNYNFIDTEGWGFYKQGKYKEALELLQRGWSLRTFYDHNIFLHLQEVKKAVASHK